MLSHLWQSTLFAGAAWLLILALRRNRANARYCVWLAASVKFLIPFSLLIGIGNQMEWKVQPVVVPTSVTRAMALMERPLTPDSRIVIPVESDQKADELEELLVFVWACGFAGLSLRWWLRWRRVRDATRGATQLAVRAGIEVRESSAMLEPGVFGIFRPVLLLPEGITEILTPEQMEAVVAHEMCHVRRRDNLATAIHMVVETVFWFHPLVWWLGGRLVEERERACDEEVLQLGSDPAVYAEGILKVCEFYLALPVDCGAGVSGADLKTRIEEIMGQRVVMRLSFSRKALLGVAALLAVAGPLTVGILNVPAMRGQSPAVKFEVASVKLCRDGGARSDSKMGPPGGHLTISPGSMNTGCAPLAAEYPLAGLMQRVYGRLALGHPLPLGSALPVKGEPAWIYSDYYEIQAKAAGNASEATMTGPMLQELLEDRFRLKVHRETQQVKVYALTLGKGGTKLQPVKEGSCTKPDHSTYPMPALPAGQKYCFNTGVGGRKGPNTMLNQDETTVDEFCLLLGLVLDRPVVNKTGLAGKYNFHLEFAIDQNTPGVVPDFPAPPLDSTPAASIFTVVQQQLGH